MTSRKPADERTADVLAATDRILRRGERLTVSGIAREAGIASGTFYLYFPSKGHLEATLIESFIDGYVGAAEQALDTDGALIDRLQRTLVAMVDHCVDHAAVLRLQVTHVPTSETQTIFADGVGRMIDLLSTAIAEAGADGTPTPPNPTMVAALLFYGVEGVMRDALTFERPIPRDAILDTLRSGLGRLLGHSSPAHVMQDSR